MRPPHSPRATPEQDRRAEIRPVGLPGIPPFVEHRDPASGLGSNHATLSVARTILGLLRPGDRFWDIGCGTGVLAVAAGLSGARSLVGADVDEHALALARRTGADANIAVDWCHGSLLEAVPDRFEADLVAANLPHKPCPDGALPLSQSGGPDGTRLHSEFAIQAEARLQPGASVCFCLHSLPHPQLLLQYHEAFDLTLHAWKRRFVGEGEFPDLWDGWAERIHAGTSYFADGHLIVGVWVAKRR